MSEFVSFGDLQVRHLRQGVVTNCGLRLSATLEHSPRGPSYVSALRRHWGGRR